MYGVLTLMGTEAALFSPARMGCLPEIVLCRPALGGQRLDGPDDHCGDHRRHGGGHGAVQPDRAGRRTALGDFSAAALIGVALLGLLVSLRIARLRPANPSRRFPLNAVGQTWRDLATLGANLALLLAALASTFYWFLAAGSQVNIDRLVTVGLGMDQQYVSYLLAALAVGVGLGMPGRPLVGRQDRVGNGPWAAAGMAVSCLLLSSSRPTPAHCYRPATWEAAWGCWLWASGRRLLRRPPASLFAAPLAAAVAGADPGGLQFIAFSGMSLAGGTSGSSAKSSSCPPGKSSSCGGLATLPVALLSARILAVEALRFAPLDDRRNALTKDGLIFAQNEIPFLLQIIGKETGKCAQKQAFIKR